MIEQLPPTSIIILIPRNVNKRILSGLSTVSGSQQPRYNGNLHWPHVHCCGFLIIFNTIACFSRRTVNNKHRMTNQDEHRLFLDVSSTQSYEANATLNCVVRDPFGQIIFTDIKHADRSIREIRFWPEVTGTYNVHIFYGGKQLPDCPYVIEIKN